MGPAFDTKRMALDNPHNLTGIRREKKRSKRSWESASGYAQEDDAMRTMGQEEDDNMEDEWEDLEEWLEDDDQWLEEDDGGSDLGGVQTLHDLIRARRDSPQNTKNPHKKRRNDKPNKDQRRHSKKHRKERRGQASDTEHTRKWHCEMKEVWKKMPEGYFPPYIQTGKCRQTTCLDGKFQCTPRKYAIQVLKRDPHSCLPVPLTLDSTTYEESWSFVDHKVTVCCECSQPVAILGHSWPDHHNPHHMLQTAAGKDAERLFISTHIQWQVDNGAIASG